MTRQHSCVRSLRGLAGVFTGLVAAVAFGGHFYYRSQRTAFEERANQTLSAVAGLKAAAVGAWLEERLAEGELLGGNPFLVQAARRFFQTDSSARGDDLLAWMVSLKMRQNYADVHLLDASGTVRLSTSRGAPELESQTAAAASKAVRERRVGTCDLHHDGSGQLRLSVAAPLVLPGGDTAVGAIVLFIDPQQFLYPQLQGWPAPSRTAETSLVRREGDRVLYLNDLRHRKNTAVSLSIPLTRRGVPAVQAVMGGEDRIGGVDYRGIEVLAAARPVPNSSWFVVAKEDAAEIYNPLRERAATAVFVAILLLGAAGAALALIWRQREARFYRECYEEESKRRALLDAVFTAQTDGVLVCDSIGEVIRSNAAAGAHFGFDPTGMPISEFTKVLGLQDGVKASVTWRALQGETLIAVEQSVGDRIYEASAAPMRDPEGRITGSVTISRDVTQRKRDEAALRTAYSRLESALAEKTVLLKEVHHRVKNNLAVISSLLSLKADSTANCEARLVLEDSRRRVHSIALIHEHLYGSDGLNRINFAEYGQRLVQELHSTFVGEPGRVSIAFQADTVELGIDRAVPCALILNELLSNAFKHAFAEGRNGKILVAFREAEPGCLELAVQDDGIGLPVGIGSRGGKSSGLRIVEILTSQLDGELRREPAMGTRMVLRFPVRSPGSRPGPQPACLSTWG